MKKVIVFLLFLQAMMFVRVEGQEKKRVYEIPAKYVSLLLVSDPKCPLQLESPRFLDYEKGTFEFVFTISNRTDKSVKNFQIKELSWFGNAAYSKNITSKDEFALLPYERISTLPDNQELEFGDFKEDLVEKLGLRENPKQLWIILVSKVELSDGTIYDITSKYNEIEKAVGELNVNSKMSLSETNNKEKALQIIIKEIINK